MISLTNKVALVTGGARGIGAACSILLAKAGADVVINYSENAARAAQVKHEVELLGLKAITHKADVASTSESARLVERALIEFGKIDIVVNNAGIWTYAEIGNTPEEVWDRTIDVNLKGVFNICNAVVPHMKQNGGGKIINISSTAGQRGEAFHSHYAASKGGLIAFTKSLASELGRFNINVNCVAPGWVETEMSQSALGDTEVRRQINEAIPLNRVATAEDTAGSVLFLASELARHITGATINVNGGSVLV
jgi:3-oxoacyl-[acyl-carrier protein] reductase